MSFWSWIKGELPPPAEHPGDPNGVELLGEDTYSRSLPSPVPSSWNGWPAEWVTPAWSAQIGMSRMVDIAWAAIDLNASILSSFPVYRQRNGEILPSVSWMTNPDPSTYSGGWPEFCKQAVWDFLASGECFILAMGHDATGYPNRFRVVPPWLVSVEMADGARRYQLGDGGADISSDMLHIRYSSTTTDAHGHGPLEVGGARMTAVGLLQKYAQRIAETGGTPFYWMEIDRRLTASEAEDLLNRWVESRARHSGEPAIVSGGADLKQATSMSARDMALVELQTLSEARIAVLLGVPPFLLGLPMAMGESLTYSNSTSLFEFHEKSSLRPKANMLMTALSNWLLPRGQSLELNRDDYSRPGFAERAAGWKTFVEIGAIDGAGVAQAERFTSDVAPGSLTGADMIGTPPQPVPAEVPPQP